MKKTILTLFLFLYSASAFSVCLVGTPPGWNAYPIQVEYWGWQGTIYPNFATNYATVKNADGSILGTYYLDHKSSSTSCTGTSGWTLFKLPGTSLGDGNTWVLLERFSAISWKHTVLWNGVEYERSN